MSNKITIQEQREDYARAPEGQNAANDVSTTVVTTSVPVQVGESAAPAKCRYYPTGDDKVEFGCKPGVTFTARGTQRRGCDNDVCCTWYRAAGERDLAACQRKVNGQRIFGVNERYNDITNNIAKKEFANPTGIAAEDNELFNGIYFKLKYDVVGVIWTCMYLQIEDAISFIYKLPKVIANHPKVCGSMGCKKKILEKIQKLFPSYIEIDPSKKCPNALKWAIPVVGRGEYAGASLVLEVEVSKIRENAMCDEKMLSITKMDFSTAVNTVCCPFDDAKCKEFKGHYDACSEQIRKLSMCAVRFFFVELEAFLQPICASLEKTKQGFDKAISALKGGVGKKKSPSKPAAEAQNAPKAPVCPTSLTVPKRV